MERRKNSNLHVVREPEDPTDKIIEEIMDELNSEDGVTEKEIQEELARRKRKKQKKTKANAVPNCSLVKYYEAGVPQWHMEVILTMLKQKNLTVLQEFILKFISAGIENVAEIRSFLGINESAINNAVAVLQKNSFISVDIFYSKLKLTDKGEKALREAAIIVPEDIEYALYVDGRDNRVRPYASKDCYNSKYSRRGRY